MSNYDKLTPEQKIVTDKWVEERVQRQSVFDNLESGKLTLEQAMVLLEELSPSHCEHGRHIVKPCSECDAIERIINPDFKSVED